MKSILAAKTGFSDSVALRFYVGEMKFLPKSPVGAGIGNPREHVNELASSGP